MNTLRAPAPLLSAQWFRVAGLRPALDAQAPCQRMVLRGEVWHVLTRGDGKRSFRLNAAAWSAVARCDGRLTVQRIWDIVLAEWGDDAPTQDELLDMLARLSAAGLMSFDHKPDFGMNGVAADAAAEPGPDQAMCRNSVFSWRFPLGNPDAWLVRGAPAVRWAFTRMALLLWLLGVAWAVVAALPHAREIAAELRAGLGTPRMVWMAALAWPLIKLLHELAHGLTARHFGARVPEWGITLLMFMPVPYVEASAASALAHRHQRLAVAAAGIVLELGLAAAALGGVLWLQPGALRDAALVVFFIGAVSTLLVNANPLMRFDGYHMLCDALALPNLGPRSARHWLQRLRRMVLKVQSEPAAATAPGETRWLWLYAPAALVARWAIALSVWQWLASVSFVLGTITAGLFAWMLVGAPLRALWRWLRGGAMAESDRAVATRRVAAAALALAVPLAALPWPDATVAQGVLWLPEHALVRAQSAGFVQAVLVADGQAVQRGDALVQLHSPELPAQLQGLQGRIAALQSEQAMSLREDPARAMGAAHALRAATLEWDQLQQRLADLTVRAQTAGRVSIAHAADLPGRHVARGALLAHVITGESGIVRVAIPQERAALVAGHPGAVAVRRADARAAPLAGRWSGTPSGGGALLPSAALGEAAGGRIATDPQDQQGLRPTQPVMLGEVQLDGAPAERLGERVLVRFDHGLAPLAWQAARALQQQLLRHFNPAQ